MKILLLCPHIDLSEHTAPAIHVCEICKNLTKLGNKIFLVSSTTDGHLPPLKNIKHYSIKTKATGIGRWLICEVLGFLLGAKVILKEKIDLVYERHYPTAIGVLLAKMFGKASVVEVNGLVADEARLSKGFLKRIIGRLGDFEFVLSGRADRIISVTPKIRDVMVGEAGIRKEKIRVVLNGVNTELFKPKGFVKSKRVIFTGFIAPWQGLEELIDAAPLVVAKVPSAKFLVVGDGPSRREIEKLAGEKGVSGYFKFLGSQPYEKSADLINSARVCVTLKKPIKSGYSPLKLYAYAACGKPIIATRTSGFEDIEKHRFGFLVNPEDSKETAGAIIRVLSNDALARRMGRQARLYGEAHSWRNVAREVEKVCKEALKAKQEGTS